MNKEIIKTKPNKFFSVNLLLVLFAIYVINKNLVFSVLNFNSKFLLARKIILYSLYAVLLLRLFINYVIYKKKLNVKWIFYIFLTLCITAVTRDLELFILLLIILNYKDIEFDRVIKTCFYSNLFATILIITLSKFGIIENWIYKIGNQVQYSLGYNYSTIPATYLFLLVLMRFYIKRGNVKLYEILINIVLAVIMYNYTLSLTGCGLVIIISLLEIIYKIITLFNINNIKEIFKNNVVKNTVKIFPIFLIVLSIVSTYSYDENSKIWVKINNVFSNRLILANRAIKEYGVPILGKKIRWVGNGGRGYIKLSSDTYNFVDNAYMRIIFDKGIIYFITLLVLLVYYQNKLIEKQKYSAIIIEIILITWAVVEPNILKVENNIFLIPFFATTLNEFKLFYGEKTNEKDSN